MITDIVRAANVGAMLRLEVPPGAVALLDDGDQYAATIGGLWRRLSPIAAYAYNAVVVRVVDGDTVHLDVDLGFGVWLRSLAFRLAGCNARELHDPGGREARDHLADVLPAGADVRIRSVKTDKYARWDAQIDIPGAAPGMWTDLVSQLVAEQWAAPWDGRGSAPVPPWPRPADKLLPR